MARLDELGAEARIETEPAHGTYWWPLGIGAAAATIAGWLRFAAAGFAAALGTAAAAALADEYRRASAACAPRLPQSLTHNVVASSGPRTPNGRRRGRPPRRRALGVDLSPRDPRGDLPSGEGADRALRHQPGTHVAAARLAAARGRVRAHRQPVRGPARGAARIRLCRLDGADRVPRGRAGRQRQRHRGRPVARARPPAARGADRVDPRDPALDRRGGVVLGG